MLTPETIEKMNAMKLFGLVSAFETQSCAKTRPF